MHIQAFAPSAKAVLPESLGRIADMLERFKAGDIREILTLGTVGTFVGGWLLPRLASFREEHPFIDPAPVDQQQPR